jgi:preprotein translocase subunit SecG
MITLFIILMITACIGLGFMVLIQNPKGGGLNANVGGLSNNFMGVKQTTDVLEKGTWIFVTVIAVLAMTSTLFLKSAGSGDSDKGLINKVNTSATAPVQAAPSQAAPNSTTAPAQNAPASAMPATK